MNLKGNKGITLIALVVTIIVLIILAGVSINLVLGDNGILTKAKEAKEESNEAQIKEKMQLAAQEYIINRNTGDVTTLGAILRENLDESKIEEITENGKTAVVTYNGERIKIDLEKGTIGEDETFDVWDGQSASEGLIGKGTEEEPYLIYSAKDLYYMSKCVGQGYEVTVTGLNEDKTENGCNAVACEANYKLMTNIALNDISNYNEWNNGSFDKTTLNTWMPIGRNEVTSTSGKTFCGNFDGNGYEITGMYIENTEGWTMGLFGFVGKHSQNIVTIKNIRVTNVYIIGKTDVGAIVGTCYDNKVIENCYSSGYIEAKKSQNGGGAKNAGGIVGECSGGKIVACINDAEIRGGWQTGGIVGKLNGIIENCQNNGNVYGYQDVGGIVGIYYGEGINNCTNIGNITHYNGTNSSYIGGIVGRVSDGTIKKCYNSGNIIDMVGGNWNYVGGIVGFMSCGRNIEIVDCNNTGNINGDINYVGGIVGEPYNVGEGRSLTLINCTNTGKIEVTNTYVGELVGRMREYVIIK